MKWNMCRSIFNDFSLFWDESFATIGQDEEKNDSQFMIVP